MVCTIGPRPVSAKRRVQVLTQGVVSVEDGPHLDAIPYARWRCGDWTKPPLDLAIDVCGSLMSVQFVLQDEHVEAGSGFERLCASNLPELGTPVFAISGWTQGDYVDLQTPVECWREGDDLCVQLRMYVPAAWIRFSELLEVGITSENWFAGLRFRNLNESEWARVYSAFVG